MAQQRGAVPRSGGTARLVTGVVVLAVALGGLEAVVRVVDGVGSSARNYVAEKLSLLGGPYPSAYDPQLGHVPRPRYDGTASPWGTRVSIDAASLRQNAPGEPAPAPAAVVAVGGSVTFGDEVSNEQSWPAQLQAALGQPVANGGVFGYGLDQAVLRAEALVPRYRPWAVVVSFVYDDVRRNQLIQQHGVEKPYFDVADGDLVLRNVPPSPNRPRVAQMGLLRTTLGYSYLADWTARRLGATEWWYSGGFPQVQVHSDGVEVACLLMRRLRGLEESGGAKVLVAALYKPRNFATPADAGSREEVAGTAAVLKCASEAGLDTLDTLPMLQSRHRASPTTFFGQYYVRSHLSAVGNRLLAERIADTLALAHGG